MRGSEAGFIEKNPERVRDPANTIIGNAADLSCLEHAGIRETPTIIVTTADDATNIYLTIYCRRLRPDVQIISRATHERNVSTLHRAGADFVMSYSSMGAGAIINLIQRGDVVMVAEGLDLIRVQVPPALAGKSLRESRIRETTRCHVVAVQAPDGTVKTNPDPSLPIPSEPGAELILVGATEDERRFLEQFGAAIE